MTITAKQRNEFLRCEYILDMSIYKGHPEFFVFVDETGTDRRDRMRRFGYSLRGKPAVASKLLVRGQRVSAIVGMSYNGILDFQEAHVVLTFIITLLMPCCHIYSHSMV